ncbi:MAG: hypothetical protein SF339_28560 [Blastocatellia bacterium]|nr:hypothetical protein [Blastocatellia bacterium]
MLEKRSSSSRDALWEDVRRHADLLATQFDQIEAPHRAAAGELAAWMSANYHPDEPMDVIIVCTGNSRRSMLGSTMGNIAAAYYGMPNIRFYSGGTAPSAFNPRTVATLREIGVEIAPTGKEAARGEGDEPNPIYRVQWGQGMETLEFSKTCGDPQNPQSGFAALLVCTEADAACPTVRGAAKRLSVPYLDPKDADGSSFEAATYAERRDDIGRFMLRVLMQVQLRK